MRFVLPAIILVGLALLPLATAGPQEGILADVAGPTVSGIALSPNPVGPGVVMVTATATDVLSNVTRAEFWIDLSGPDSTSRFSMETGDCCFDSRTEEIRWVGPFPVFSLGLLPGSHILLVHAEDAAGNWGEYASFDFVLSSPDTSGPDVTFLAVSPDPVRPGEPFTVNAFVEDSFGAVVTGAEFFVDSAGPDGTGVRLSPIDAFDSPREGVSWTGALSEAPGEHAVLVHAQNDRGSWGLLRSIPFTSRAPAFTLLHLVDPVDAGPGILVTHTLVFDNVGNDRAHMLWLNLTSPSFLSYESDTASTIGGTRTGTDFTFRDVPPGPLSFYVLGTVLEWATDGVSLEASVTLDYTNEVGFDFEALSSRAGGTVVAPEVALSVLATPAAYSGEAETVTVGIDHTGVRTIPFVDITLGASPWIVFDSDDAALIGGMPLGSGRWRFSDLAPGSYSFHIRERIAPDAPDRLPLNRTAIATYVSRVGSPTAVSATDGITILRPSFTLQSTADRVEVETGELITVTLSFVNVGSVRAGHVSLRMVLPPGLTLYEGDMPTQSAGTEHIWARTAVSPGAHSLTFALTGSSATSANLFFDLTYTSPGGVPLGTTSSELILEILAVQPPTPGTTFPLGVAVAATAIASIGFLATERGKSALFLFLVPLYTRLQRERILDNETRGMIRGYIVANPGDHYNSIKEALELPNGTLAYHVQVLQKEMIVRSVKDGKFRRFYPAEMRVPEGGEPTKVQRVILEIIRANPGIRPRDAAGLLGLTSSTVSYHLDKLEEHGRIEYRREGIAKRLYVRGDLDAP